MILDFGSSIELIRVTAQYSNAVLVAVLPYISDVAQKLDLPLPQPITTQHVFHCSILPSRQIGNVSAEVGVEGNWFFVFEHGHIETIQGPHEFFGIQDFDRIPEFYGDVRMSKSEAIQFARNTITKLGVPLEAVFAEQEPRVTEPIKFGTNTVPHYRIQWLDPRGAGVSTSVDMEINGNAKRLERIRIFSKSLERPSPKISVVPPPDPRSPRWPSANPEYARRLIPIALRAIDEYGKKLALPIPRPLTTNHVMRFSLVDNGGWPHAEVELTNGWRFIYRNSMVNGYYAPDNLFNSDQRPILIKEFTGEWKMTEKEAIELVRRAIAKLNYPTNLVHMDFAPQVVKPALPGIPRYSFWWHYENAEKTDLQSKVEAEVDADKGELKSLYYDDTAYWNKPPPIDVPISLPMQNVTNPTPAKKISPPVRSKPPPRKFAPFPTPQK